MPFVRTKKIKGEKNENEKQIRQVEQIGSGRHSQVTTNLQENVTSPTAWLFSAQCPPRMSHFPRSNINGANFRARVRSFRSIYAVKTEGWPKRIAERWSRAGLEEPQCKCMHFSHEIWRSFRSRFDHFAGYFFPIFSHLLQCYVRWCHTVQITLKVRRKTENDTRGHYLDFSKEFCPLESFLCCKLYFQYQLFFSIQDLILRLGHLCLYPNIFRFRLLALYNPTRSINCPSVTNYSLLLLLTDN